VSLLDFDTERLERLWLDHDIEKLERALATLEREFEETEVPEMKDDFTVQAMVVLGELTHLRNERSWL
jgi:hypothetical protein